MNNADKKVNYSKIIMDRIYSLMKGKKLIAIADKTGISYDHLAYLRRCEGGEPVAKYIDEETIQALRRYFECTRDYLLGESDDPKKEKDGRKITFPIKDIYIEEFEYLDKKYRTLKREDKVLLARFFKHAPQNVQDSFVGAVRSMMSVFVSESLSTFIDHCSDIDNLKVNVELGLYDRTYVAALIHYQEAQSHVLKKRYKSALYKDCKAIKCMVKGAKPDDSVLYQLYDVICDHIRGIKDAWSGYPNDILITNLIDNKNPNSFSDNDLKILESIIEKLTEKRKENELPPDKKMG